MLLCILIKIVRHLKIFLKPCVLRNTIITHKLLARTRLINRIPTVKLKHMSFLITYAENIFSVAVFTHTDSSNISCPASSDNPPWITSGDSPLIPKTCCSTQLINWHQQFVKHIIVIKTIIYNNESHFLKHMQDANSQLVKFILTLEILIFVKYFSLLKMSFKIYFWTLVSIPCVRNSWGFGGSDLVRATTRFIK